MGMGSGSKHYGESRLREVHVEPEADTQGL